MKSSSKNTKTRILQTALRLFNDLGLAKVTLRTIAKEMGISQGNLTYHYKKREDILVALYYELVAKMDVIIADMEGTPPSLSAFFLLSKQMMQQFFDYRFFMLDFVQIMREHAVIHEHYKQLSSLRQQQFLGMFQLWIAEGLIRPEEFDGEYHNLYLRSNILGDFWLASAMTQQTISPDLVEQYSHVVFQNMYPYLTAKGKEEFQKLMD